MMKTNLKLVFLFIVSAIIVSACAGNRDQKLAVEVVDKYHKLYNEQNYEEIFNAAHEDAKRTKSKEALGFKLAEAFEKYGKHLGSELVHTKITEVPNSVERQVEFAFRSKFENGTRNETFLIVTDDQKAALHSIGELSDEELERLKSK